MNFLCSNLSLAKDSAFFIDINENRKGNSEENAAGENNCPSALKLTGNRCSQQLILALWKGIVN
ncbi:hypothetical protein [Kaarinaea lacus]